MKKIYFFEPVFFLFFGAFHLHRVWALVDRQHYADFWIGLFREKGVLYFLLMGTLACFCILGIAIFFRNRQKNYKWRWIYLIGYFTLATMFINELRSIIENLIESGINVPTILTKGLSVIEDKLEQIEGDSDSINK